MIEPKLRCGVIGVGRMGRHHARVYAQLPGVELVGVVDKNADSRKAIVEQWGGREFETVEQMIAAGVDAVTIATPTVFHRSAAEPLLKAKVACLIEKPLAPDAEEARALWDLHQAGPVRELYFRADRPAAVLVLECDSTGEAAELLAGLPFVRAGLIAFDLVPLRAYPGFGRLFKELTE